MKHLRSVILLSFVPFCFFTENIQSQDTSIIKFFPLNVGNVWVYYRSMSPPLPPGYGKNEIRVESRFISMNHFYYILRTTVYYSNGTIHSTGTESYRIDSLTGNIYKLGITSECLYDSLKLKKNDSASLPCGNYCGSYVKCSDTSTFLIFGQTPKSKTFYSSFFEGGCYRKYAKNFGLVFSDFRGMMIYNNLSLIGCLIDGILYGDTNLVGITQISYGVPNKFSLSQNYPNPFNPTTKIRFSVSHVGAQYIEPVQLIIYDILGREIQTLVNEQLSPGTYEVEFDGTNYPSGVYYFTLTAYEFNQTKRMVLIK